MHSRRKNLGDRVSSILQSQVIRSVKQQHKDSPNSWDQEKEERRLINKFDLLPKQQSTIVVKPIAFSLALGLIMVGNAFRDVLDDFSDMIQSVLSINKQIQMVLLHYKKTDHNQFLYQTTGTRSVGQISDEVVELNNMRIKVDIFACAIEDLATHGPQRPEQIRGLTDQELIDNALIIASEDKKQWAHTRQPQGDQRFNEDKTHYRIGIIKNEQLTKMMIETTNKAKRLVSYKMVDEKLILTMPMLKQVWEELRAALIIAYPDCQGLGEWEPARLMYHNQFEWEDIHTDQIDYLDPKDSTMWWAGKELLRQKPLNAYVGKNQKTKIIVKLTKSGSGAPMREPPIDEKTKSDLMAMYHRKQQEMKKIESTNEDDFAHSSWANPNNLKSYLVTGGKGVGFKNMK